MLWCVRRQIGFCTRRRAVRCLHARQRSDDQQQARAEGEHRERFSGGDSPQQESESRAQVLEKTALKIPLSELEDSCRSRCCRQPLAGVLDAAVRVERSRWRVG
eukprot:6466662-Prymnesium_polylepis.1